MTLVHTQQQISNPLAPKLSANYAPHSRTSGSFWKGHVCSACRGCSRPFLAPCGSTSPSVFGAPLLRGSSVPLFLKQNLKERVEGQTAAPLTGVGLRATAGLGHLPPPLTILNSPCSALMSAALRGSPGGGMQTLPGNFILSGQYCCSSPF